MEASIVLVHLVTKEKRVTVSINIPVYKYIILYTTGREVLTFCPIQGARIFHFVNVLTYLKIRPESSNFGARKMSWSTLTFTCRLNLKEKFTQRVLLGSVKQKNLNLCYRKCPS